MRSFSDRIPLGLNLIMFLRDLNRSSGICIPFGRNLMGSWASCIPLGHDRIGKRRSRIWTHEDEL